MKEKEQLNEYSGHVLITQSITNFRVCSMLIEAKGGGRWGKPMAATMGCPLPKWNGERVGWEATGLCLLTGRDDPGTGGTGDGNRRGSVGGGLNGMAWAEERAVGKLYAGFNDQSVTEEERETQMVGVDGAGPARQHLEYMQRR
jgi:hypothetical protein